jgi:hypothetical protein
MSERTISGGLLRSSGLVPLFYSVQRNPAKTPVLQELRGGRAAYVEVPAPPSLDLGSIHIALHRAVADGLIVRVAAGEYEVAGG